MDDFKRFFRVTRSTFDIIHNKLAVYQELLPGWSGGRTPIPIDKQLLMTLWYLSGKETLNRVADRFNVTESSVVRCRDRVFKVFCDHLKSKFIQWPEGYEQNKTIDGFYQKSSFPSVIGAIDGTHIKIKAPVNHPETYVNRKGFHSVLLQAVCREDMRFTHIVAGWPGSCHDARVLRNCDLWNDGEAMCRNAHIIGDAAYPLRTWLITPYRDNGHLTGQQKHFNTCLSTTRVTVERAFGMLKGRFGRLQTVDTKKVKTTIDLIVVCCVLHNICILNEDEVLETFIEDGVQVPQQVQAHRDINEAEGSRKRDRIAQNL